MKNKVALIMIVLFPYFAIGSIFLSLATLANSEESLASQFFFLSPFVFISVIPLFLLATSVLAIRALYRNLKEGTDAQKLLWQTLLIKLLHLPGYVILLIVIAVVFNPFLMILIPLIFFIGISTMVFGGLFGVSAVQILRREGKLSSVSSIAFSLMQFILVMDIGSLIFLLWRQRRYSEDSGQ